MDPLQSLPIELLTLTVCFLEKDFRSVVALALTCKYFYQLILLSGGSNQNNPKKNDPTPPTHAAPTTSSVSFSPSQQQNMIWKNVCSYYLGCNARFWNASMNPSQNGNSNNNSNSNS